MYLLSALSYAFLFSEASALLALEARATNVADTQRIQERSPRPTSGPFAAKWNAQDDAKKIFERQNSYATCGFIDKDFDAAITCAAGYGCGWWPSNPQASISFGFTQGAVECCPVRGNSIDFDNCNLANECVDYNGRYAGETTIEGTQYCGSEYKRCATWSFVQAPATFSGSAAEQTYTHLFCTTAPTVQLVYQTATNAESSFIASSSRIGGVAPKSSILMLDPTPSDGSDSSRDEPKESSSGGGGGVSVRAIAGGVVGGVVVLALIGGLIGWFMWKKKRERKPVMPEVSTY